MKFEKESLAAKALPGFSFGSVCQMILDPEYDILKPSLRVIDPGRRMEMAKIINMEDRKKARESEGKVEGKRKKAALKPGERAVVESMPLRFIDWDEACVYFLEENAVDALGYDYDVFKCGATYRIYEAGMIDGDMTADVIQRNRDKYVAECQTPEEVRDWFIAQLEELEKK